MKTILKLIVFIVLLTMLLKYTTSCTVLPEQHSINSREMCVKTIPIRLAKATNDLSFKQTKENVSFSIIASKFTLNLADTTINLTGLYKYSAEREFYEAYDKDHHKYSLYLYAYRGRVYIQITPLHNAQVPYIDKSEVIYIVTTDSICS